MYKASMKLWLALALTVAALPDAISLVEARGSGKPQTAVQQKRRQGKLNRARKPVPRVNPTTPPATAPRQNAPARPLSPPPMVVSSTAAPGTKLPKLESNVVLVMNEQGQEVYSKNAQEVHPIASITKLMTAMVTLDANLPMNEVLTVTEEDKDNLRHSRSRLRPGAALSREQMLRVALMSSENRAASTLGRTTFPGGMPDFVAAMNRKAQSLGMTNSSFADPTGLLVTNVSTAADLVKMLEAARNYPLIQEATTTSEADFSPYAGKPPMHYVNTNRFVHYKSADWEILLSKTGFINEAGRCLVMEAKLPKGTYDFVLLNAPGKLSPFGDSNRLRRWIDQSDQSGGQTPQSM